MNTFAQLFQTHFENRYQSKLGTMTRITGEVLLLLTGSLFLGLLAQISFYIPFSLVPITAQTFGVLVIGAAMGPWRAAAAVLTYLTEGALGLPVFAGGAFGILPFIGPTAGYLLGFIPAAWLVGWFAQKGYDRSWKKALPAFLIGHAVIFFFGILWLSQFVGLQGAITTGLLPFIPGMILKTVAASAALPAAWKFTQFFSGR